MLMKKIFQLFRRSYLFFWLKCSFYSIKLYYANRGKNIILGHLCLVTESELGVESQLYNNVRLHKTKIGMRSYIANNSSILYANIGNYCSIGPSCKIGLAEHPIRECISTSPHMYEFKVNSKADSGKYAELPLDLGYRQIEIGNDVWIGADVIIKSGMNIGDGAIIGAGAVVTDDVEPFSINVGVPARKIGMRFDKEFIDKICESKWWLELDKVMISELLKTSGCHLYSDGK